MTLLIIILFFTPFVVMGLALRDNTPEGDKIRQQEQAARRKNYQDSGRRPGQTGSGGAYQNGWHSDPLYRNTSGNQYQF